MGIDEKWPDITEIYSAQEKINRNSSKIYHLVSKHDKRYKRTISRLSTAH